MHMNEETEAELDKAFVVVAVLPGQFGRPECSRVKFSHRFPLSRIGGRPATSSAEVGLLDLGVFAQLGGLPA
jgi:hypothetical protein